jgi:hypothetical protein
MTKDIDTKRSKEATIMQSTESQSDTKTLDESSRVRGIRARLPGQMLRERIDLVRASYGPLYSLTDVRRKVAETLPHRLGYVRGAVVEPIESYQERIPDDALLKYDDAVRTGMFDKFWVLAPTYYRERQLDPWIVGQVAGVSLCAVIAQWDV